MAGVAVLRRDDGRALGVVERERVVGIGIVVVGVTAGVPTGDTSVAGEVPMGTVAPGVVPGVVLMVPAGFGTVVPGVTGVLGVMAGALGVTLGVGVPIVWAWAGRLKATSPSRAAPPKKAFLFITN